MATSRATLKHKGLTDGVTSEWTLIGKVKPGQEQALREFIKAREEGVNRSEIEAEIIIPVGTVHDYRLVFFDNGTRAMFMSNFDGDWSQYIDDFFATKVVAEQFDGIFSHCEGYPVSGSVEEKKKWYQAHTQEAAAYTRAYHATTKEIWKALEVQKAFQQVLDNPDAAEALAQTPALKPLLDLAAK